MTNALIPCEHPDPTGSLLRRWVIAGLSTFLICASASAAAADESPKGKTDVIGLASLYPPIPILDVVADETIRRLEAQGIAVRRLTDELTLESIKQNAPPELLLAGLDSFIAQWHLDKGADSTNGDRLASAGGLLGSLRPVVEVVRDHQAFLMLHKPNAQELRSRFAMAHGARGPMSIGGLSPEGHSDHLVAMMLMDTVGQDSLRYPYRQYDSLQSMALGLLTDEVQLLSIPVSKALQMPLEGGIKVVATSGNEKQDVMRNVPTLRGARIDMMFTNYIGLYTAQSDEPNEQLQILSGLGDLSVGEPWPDRVYELGLVDDYANTGKFAVNVLRELSRLRRFAQMLDMQ